MNSIEVIPYKKVGALDKKIRPLILTWLCSLVGIDYKHDWRDQWISWNIWDGRLSISLDQGVDAQKELFEALPMENKGTKQYKTGILVNKDVLYYSVEDIVDVSYPEISNHILKYKHRHVDNDGDEFFTYDWQVFLSDGTSIMYNNQYWHMDLKKGDYIYNATIQERAYVTFLQSQSK